ncbi:MAG: hypothetical protein ACREUA_07815 [Burkholderiales bacterium]
MNSIKNYMQAAYGQAKVEVNFLDDGNAITDETFKAVIISDEKADPKRLMQVERDVSTMLPSFIP